MENLSNAEILEILRGCTSALSRSTQPLAGHTNPGSIGNRWAEMNDALDELEDRLPPDCNPYLLSGDELDRAINKRVAGYK